MIKKLTESFRFTKNNLIIALVEVAFLMLLMLTFNLFIMTVTNALSGLSDINLDSGYLTSSNEAAQDTAQKMRPHIITLYISLPAFLLLVVLLAGISKYFIWHIAEKGVTTLSFRKLLHYIGFNYIWLLIWLIPLLFPFVLLVAIGKVNGLGVNLAIIIITLLIYFIYGYFSFFAGWKMYKNDKYLKTILDTMKTGVLIFPRLILPLIIAFVILNIILIPFSFLEIGMMYSIPLVALFLAWIRRYILLYLKNFRV